MRPYLLGLRLDGRRVVVIGGGRVAQRRVPALLAAGADVVLVSPEVTPVLEDLADARRADLGAPRVPRRRLRRRLARAGLHRRRQGQRRGRRRGREPRDLVRTRRRRRRRPPPGPRRAAGVGETCRRRAGRRRPAARRGRSATPSSTACATAPSTPGHSRRKPVGVALVGGGPGDPGLITVRGRQLLAQADVVVTDRLAPRELLDELRRDVEVIDAAKIPYGRSVDPGAHQRRAGRARAAPAGSSSA